MLKVLKNRRAQSLLAIAFSLIVVWVFVFPAIISFVYGNRIPPAWKATLLDRDIGEIHQLLGEPTEDLGVKESQLWVNETWFGRQQLTIVVPCCLPSARPSGAFYSIYIDGHYSPAVVRPID